MAAPLLAALIAAFALAADDPRDIRNGTVIPDEGYCDQPYVVITKDGNWLCVLTTGAGREGDRGQHVVSARSEDRGKTWSPLVPIEPADGPESSWAVPLITPSGRVYAFYDYNGDEVRELKGRPIRADMLGWYVFRYSDDHGRTWSKERHRLPVRTTACDRGNDWKGRVQIFWGIDKPKARDGAVLFGFTKLGRYMLERGEGWFFRSENILAEPDPAKIEWRMLPEGDRGVRREEFGSVQEEHNAVPLGGDRWFCAYRTTKGFPCQSISEDGGRHWSEPEPLRYEAGGHIFKHPRACPKLFRTTEGRFLLWFHNHGGTDFQGRNPAWIAGGRAEGKGIAWSAPEIALHHPDPALRMSYPDLIEQDGRAWLTETQKDVARVHPVDPALWDCLMGRAQPPAENDPHLATVIPPGANGDRPSIPALSFEDGFALDLELDGAIRAGSILEAKREGGIAIDLTPGRSLLLRAGAGPSAWSFESDPIPEAPGRAIRATLIADGPARIGTWVIDGRLCDGGESRPQGWSRIPAGLATLPESEPGPAGEGLKSLRVLRRSLRHAEAIAWQNSGR